MELPEIGVGVPGCGAHAGPQAIAAVASAAEAVGLHSVWTFERLLRPVSADGTDPYGLPDSNASVYDPLETLTWVAAGTRRIRLGTSVLDALFHPPVVLAKRLATLDRLSGGRLVAGLGQGWMPEEYAATGVPAARRGAGFADHLDALRACWGPDPVAHDGPRYRIPRSTVGPKPVAGRVPVLVGGVVRPAVERAAHLGDGFAAVFQDWDTLATQTGWYRDASGDGSVVLRVNPDRVDAPAPAAPFTGDPAAVVADLGRAARLGVTEVIWDLNPLTTLDPRGQIDAFERLATAYRDHGGSLPQPG